MGIKERKRRERNERKELILRAAKKAYMEDGWYSTTMEKIAEKAELSRATLYLYYKTKDHIFIDAVTSFLENLSAMLEDLYLRIEEVKENLLRELWQVFVDFYHTDPEMFSIGLLFIQREMLPALPKELRDPLDEAGSRNHYNIFRIIEYGVKGNFFSKADPRALTEVVWSTFLGVVHIENMKKSISKKGHLESTLELAYEILERGICVG